MTLHLVQLPVFPRNIRRWATLNRTTVNIHFTGAIWHHLLSQAFGPDAFHCYDPAHDAASRNAANPRTTVLLYSSHDANELAAQAQAFATPEHLSCLDIPDIRSKPMPQSFAQDQALGFSTRTIPISRLDHPLRSTSGTYPAGALIDSFTLYRHRKPDSLPEGLTRNARFCHWLDYRLRGAARLLLEQTSAVHVSYQRFPIHNPSAPRSGTWIRFPVARLRGNLQIQDPEAFARVLSNGIGRYKAYGFGMLLLRPPATRKFP